MMLNNALTADGVNRMVDAVRIADSKAGLPPEECLRMASLYPAHSIGLG